MTQKLISVKELEDRAFRNIHSYEGQRANRLHNETGRNFAGEPASVAKPKNSSSFTLVLKNNDSAAEDQTIALLPAYFEDAASVKDGAGAAVDAIIKEGTVIATATKTVTATGKPKSIDEFLKFIKLNPTRITGMKISVDDTEQFGQDILVRKESPFRDLGFKTISPSTYQNSMQNNPKLIEIPLDDMQFDSQTSVVTTIMAGRTMTVTFFIGEIRNEAAILDQNAQLASSSYLGR